MEKNGKFDLTHLCTNFVLVILTLPLLTLMAWNPSPLGSQKDRYHGTGGTKEGRLTRFCNPAHPYGVSSRLSSSL